MYNQQRLQKTFCLLLLCFSASMLRAQVNAGAYFSTFNLPGVQLRTNGFGIIGQYEVDKKTVCELSLAYFAKKLPTDSVSYLDAGANTTYIQYNDNYSFYHVSADFIKYLAGSTYHKTKFSFYMGGGASVLYRQTKTNYHTDPAQSQKDVFTTFGFEYILGAEYKLGFARLFVRGKINFFLKYPVPMDDGTVIPLLVNTQGGILIPLIKHEKPKGRVVM
jgi:hypothetical protein